ncbi:MAG: Protein kinase, partial [Myxococcales bacterium]|nr:Protein kinase [Myxococcales bacterium]
MRDTDALIAKHGWDTLRVVLEIGSIVGGKFRIDRLLGSGGMGVVAVATHLQLDQQIALKILHANHAKNPDVCERFLREARAAAKLRSEHVCRVSDVGIDGQTPYMVMELLEGDDLSSLIEKGALPIAAAVDYVLQASVAIAEAHARGIVHRDLKPANLFVTRRFDGSPLVKVLDFGIAKAMTAAPSRLTNTDVVMGTPGYMSPEQLRGLRTVDARSDIWQLGVILYEAVSARVPFPAATITDMAIRVATEPPEPLDSEPAFREVVFKCLEKKPDRRYEDVGAFALALVPFGGPTAAANAALVAKVLFDKDTRAEALTSNDSSVVRSFVSSASGAAEQARTPKPTTLGSAAGATADARARSARRMAFALVAVLTLAVLVIALPLIFLDRDAPQSTASADAHAASSVPHDPEPVPPPTQSDEALESSAPAPHDSVPPPALTAAEIMARHRDLDTELAKHHCTAAQAIARQLTAADPNALAAVDDCIKKRDEALSHPIPSSEPWAIAMAEETADPAQARDLLDRLYASLAQGACERHERHNTKSYAGKIASTALRDSVRSQCK